VGDGVVACGVSVGSEVVSDGVEMHRENITSSANNPVIFIKDNEIKKIKRLRCKKLMWQKLLKEYALDIHMKKMNVYKISVVIEKDKDGYFAYCPELQGCYTQGETYEEVLENIKDAIKLHIEDRLGSGEEIPQVEIINLTSVEVKV